MAASERNRKVLDFAKGKLGQRVGKGTCWDLAHQALSQADARSSTTTRDNENYVWGVEVPLRQAAPGDILQFRDHVISRKVIIRATFADGTFMEKWSEDFQTRAPYGHRRCERRPEPRNGGCCWITA